jgi:hypothetical protein
VADYGRVAAFSAADRLPSVIGLGPAWTEILAAVRLTLDKDHSHHTYIYEYLQLRLERLDQDDVPITVGIAEFGNGYNELT